MPIPPAHAALIGKDKFTPECNQPPGWSDADWAKVRKYGLWYGALVDGTIEPVTPAQARLIAYIRGPRLEEPASDHERLWSAYLGRIRYVNQDPAVFGAAPRIPRTRPAALPREENGDDTIVYFSKRRKRR